MTANDVAAMFLKRADNVGQVVLTRKQAAWLFDVAGREHKVHTSAGSGARSGRFVHTQAYGDGWTAVLWPNGAALLSQTHKE